MNSVCVSGDKRNKWWQKPIVRQIFVVSLSWNTYFLTGLALGISTVAIPQMKDEGIEISPQIASWFSSIVGYAGCFWIFAPLLAQRIGLRTTLMIVYLVILIGALNIYFCNSAKHFLIGQALTGSSVGVCASVSMLFITDYSSPKYRGFCLTLKSASVYWGIWVANSIGTFFYWRFITVITILSSLYGIFLLFIPESPFWLASKGRIEECKSSFRWLRGVDDETEKELEDIINVDYNTHKNKNKKILQHVKDMTNTEFLKPFFIGFILISFYYICGKLACSVYAIEILKKLTATDRDAYKAMLLMDALTVIGIYTGCYISKKFKRRTLLFFFSCLGTLMLYTFSLYLYLVKVNLLTENHVISLVLLSLFSIFISCGPIIIPTAILGEIIPLKFRSLFTVLMATSNDITLGSSLRIAPWLFSYGLHVAFFTYGVLCTIVILILYKCLPETKDKTLVEISNIFKDKSCNKNEESDKMLGEVKY